MADIVAERFIARTTLSATSTSVTFTGIPGSYTDLVLVSSLATTSGTGGYSVRFNGDTGTNYSFTSLNGNGTSATSSRYSNEVGIRIAWQGQANTILGSQVSITSIPNYSNSTTYKNALTRDNNASVGLSAVIGTWRNTAAITSLTIWTPDAITFAIGTTFTLYGIV